MGEINDFFEKLLNADDWNTMWQTGKWSAFHGWLYIGADLLIWASLFITALFIFAFLRRKPGLQLRGFFLLFSVSILLCGITFLFDAVAFWWPGYRLDALLRFITSVISFITMISIMALFPRAKSLKTAQEFEKELAERKKSEYKFMTLLESAPYAIVLTDRYGKISLTNALMEKLFGYRRAEIIGKEIENFVPKKSAVKNADVQLKKREAVLANEYYGIRKDGSEFPVEVSLSPLKVDEEEGMIVMTAIRDISKQKLVESEIKQLNNDLERIVVERTGELELALQNEKALRAEMIRNQTRLEFLKDVSEVLTSSLNYCEILENFTKIVTPKIADWCAIYEFSSEEGSLKLISLSHANPDKTKQAFDFIEKYQPDPDAPNGVYKVIKTKEAELRHEFTEDILRKMARDEEHLRKMHELQLKSAIIVPLIIREKIFGVLLLITSESGRLFDDKDLEFAKEISRRAMLAIENARLYEDSMKINALLEMRVAKRTQELEATNKELEAFSYSVSHDLRAPLRSIDGFSNKIMKDYEHLLDDQGKDYFMRVKRASQTMGHLIDNLLKLSRLTRVEIHLGFTDLSIMAETIADDLKANEPERNVTFMIKPDMITRADQNLMLIALQNLFDNAWKYTRKQPKAKIEFSCFKKDGQVVYYIKDNGVGFDMKYIDKLFGSFQRLHTLQEFEGTGVGLATVQRIIHRHHGRIWAEAEVNKGATFYFTL